jgi:hypothetical protein
VPDGAESGWFAGVVTDHARAYQRGGDSPVPGDLCLSCTIPLTSLDQRSIWQPDPRAPGGSHHAVVAECRHVARRTPIWSQDHLPRILREYEIHHNQHRPHRSLHAAAPLNPLPEPADLGQYRVRKQAHFGGLISEYHLVA